MSQTEGRKEEIKLTEEQLKFYESLEIIVRKNIQHDDGTDDKRTIVIYPHSINVKGLMEDIEEWHKSHESAAVEGALEKVVIDENTSDGYHTFKELYNFRMLYNAHLFNEWALEVDVLLKDPSRLSLDEYTADEEFGTVVSHKYDVHKSKRHHDGEECFGGGWFIVMAELPTGQISNHYELKYWDLFRIPEKEKANKFDGHTSQDVADRLLQQLEKECGGGERE